MAIYDIKHHTQTEQEEKQQQPEKSCFKDRLFSSIAARLFFLLLLAGDIAWGALSIAMSLLYLASNLLTGFKFAFFKKRLKKSALSVRRALVCFLALLVAIISPALGIMFACSYFLMFDKKGIEEVVPA
ncbi:MAG: hypothetical protein SNF33_05980 [Candidatus Algichlamydia australiensis]|nr:hypothetical protein [Chlamydiales bacterium]